MFLLGTFLFLPSAGFAQTEEEPILVIKSRVYDVSGGSGVISIMLGATEDGYIDVDCGYGAMEYEITQANLDNNGNLVGTTISCNVSKEGQVKVYGDASKIDVLSAPECYITEAQISKLTNLEILDLARNELTQLDLTGLSALQSVSVSNNPFDVKPLKIGNDKPNLVILDMGRMSNLDPSFNLSDYPALVSFDAWGNTGLHSLDPTGCPLLRKISIDNTPVETLDVSQNGALNILNITDTRITSIDLSHNPNLQQFYCDHTSGAVNVGVKMENIDVTNNPNLVYLFASGNGLTSIDVSKNTKLQDLYVNDNRLTSIDLSNNANLLNLSIRNNNFTFATLPLPSENWLYYAYKQRTMDIARSQKVGTVLDFSDKVLREGGETTALLYKTSEANPNELTALGSDYYSYADGKITLHKAVSDSVYIAFSNDLFPESVAQLYPLCTNKFMIKTEADYGKDDKVITFTAPVMSSSGTEIKFGLGMYGATKEQPKKFYVDYGRGKVEYTATSETAPATPNVSGEVTYSGNVAVYVPENELVSAFDMEGITLNTIDFSAVPSLKTLRLVDAGIYGEDNINLKWNRILTDLVITGNHFTTLNIRGANDAYQKNLLGNIDLSNNELTTVTLNDMRTIRNLKLSDNKLTELSMKDADNMLTLDVSNNRLETVNINYCTLMASLNVANNNISSIVLPAEISLKELHCESNALNFNTLPVIPGLETYTFIPQNDILIAKIGPGADLSMYDTGDQTTTYVWKKTDGTVLKAGVDYTENNGVAHFNTPIIGTKVYCEMTNPKFDGLVLRTSEIEAAAMPTNVIATFKTTADQNAQIILRANTENLPVYIDWHGNEVDLEEYQVGTSPVQFDVTTHKGATVRVYTYSDAANLTVFSIGGASMSSIDASKLSNLALFGVQNAGLTEKDIVWPESADLGEMRLAGNKFSSLDLTRYPKLFDLDLGDNSFTTFDASVYPELQMLSISNNGLTSFKADNNKMWHLDLSRNALTEIDLSGLPDMNQIALSGNKLSHIDVSPMTKLNVLFLDKNRFKLSTLPQNNFTLYTYANQEPMQVTADADGRVDLSSEASVAGTATVYRWFVDVPSIDAEGNLVGEELYVDDEYTVTDGVTSFVSPINNVMCVLTNEMLPNAYFYTNLIDVKTTVGIDAAKADADVTIDGNSIIVRADGDIPVRLVNANGMLVRSGRTSDGVCTLSGVAKGTYVIVAGNKAYKVFMK